jgi:stage V sporulation protein G
MGLSSPSVPTALLSHRDGETVVVRAPAKVNLFLELRSKRADGRAKLHADIAHPINSACREVIQTAVLKAFNEEKVRSKQPGYVCTYDDYDSDYDDTFAQVIGELNHGRPNYRTHTAHHAPRGAHAGNNHEAPVHAAAREQRAEGFGAGIL